ncbi:MAG TPA: hypothetical protein VMT86_03290 [Bryobacteraceae bacterium]|nr:hypothetical protein [Bryobacteraceae bacterium]
MKKLMTLMLGLSIALGGVSLFAQNTNTTKKTEKKKKSPKKKKDTTKTTTSAN